MASDLEIKITGDPSGALNAYIKVASSAKEMASHVVSEAAKMAAAFVSVEKVLHFIGEGIKAADANRDLALSLGIVVGDAKRASAALEFFDQAQKDTRETGSELAKFYKDQLPLAMARGFSQDSMRHVTVWVSQLSTVLGKSKEELQGGFNALLSGNVSAKNPLLQSLGFTKADVDKLGWSEIIAKMQEVAGHAPEFGQTFESTFHKIKESALDAFGGGFNEAMEENGRKALGGLLGVFTADDATGALHNTGKFIGKILSGEIVDALVAIHLDDWIEKNLTLKNQFRFTGAGSAYDKPYLNMFGQRIEAENPYPGTEGPNTYVRQQGGSALKSVGFTHAPAGYSWEQYADTLGEALVQHRDKSVEILSAVKKGIDENTTSWVGLKGAIKSVVEPTEAVKKSISGIPSGLVKIDTEAQAAMDRLRARVEATSASIHEQTTAIAARNDALRNSAGLIEGHVANPMSPVADTYSKALAEYNADLAENTKKANEALLKQAEAIKKLGNSSPEVKKLRAEIAILWGSLDEQAAEKFRLSVLKTFDDLSGIARGFTYDSLRHVTGQPAMQGQLIELGQEARFEIARKMGKLEAESFRESMANSRFVDDFGANFADIVASGGKDFVSIIASGLKNEVATGARILSERLFGLPGDTAKGQDPNRRYDTNGRDITGRATAARRAFITAETAFGGYQAGHAGEGGRTSGALSGAMAGLSMGGPAAGYAAVALAIVGYTAAVIGEKQRQADYKYAVPWVVGGEAKLSNVNGNINAQQQQQMVRDLQEAYDTIRDSFVLMLAKIPGALIPDRGTIGGPFQREASGHFMDHWQQFIDQTLPREVFAEFGGELTNTAKMLGMSGDRFTEIWSHLQNIDPKKAVGLLDTLFAALSALGIGSTDLRKPYGFAHGANPVTHEQDFTATALWYGGQQASMPMGAVFADIDSQITQLAGALKDLSPEGQIAAFQELTTLYKQRDDMLKSAAMELYNLYKSVHDEIRADTENLEVMRLRKADGSPDQTAIAEYYKQQSQRDLFAISGAQNPQEARDAWERFRHDVTTGGMAGYNAASEGDKNKWLDWMQSMLGLGQGEVDKAVSRFGLSLDDVNSKFNSQVDPALDLFVGKTNTAGASLDDLGGAADRVIEPIERVGKKMNGLAGDIDDLRSAVVSLASYMNGTRQSSSSGSGLSSSTIVMRVAS